jgi:Family of unknown function (DUF6516)
VLDLLTTPSIVVTRSNMKAELLIDERHLLAESTFVEIVVWQVPRSVRGSRHRFKYRLALVRDEVCVLRYDNEAGKGDHRHLGNTQQQYVFTDTDTLLADFWRDVAKVESMK